jgi:hypothetical protein
MFAVPSRQPCHELSDVALQALQMIADEIGDQTLLPSHPFSPIVVKTKHYLKT